MSNISKLTDLLSYNEFAQVHDKLQPHQLLASEGNSGTHSAAALHPFPWNSPREWRVRLLRVQVSFVPEVFMVSTEVLKKIFTMHWKFSEVKRKHFYYTSKLFFIQRNVFFSTASIHSNLFLSSIMLCYLIIFLIHHYFLLRQKTYY